jgi:uncharacterized membrane protein YphA (DoxX/SURF4 family)
MPALKDARFFCIVKTRVVSALTRLTWMAATLFLAYPMASHGWMKLKPHFSNATAEQVTTSRSTEGENAPEATQAHGEAETNGAKVMSNPHVRKRRDYIRGMKATGYLWELIGVLEMLGAAMLLIRPMQFLGSAILWPITLNVFLFHAVLEPEEVGELIFTACMMVANTALLFRYWPKWRHLLYIPNTQS